ncbi:NAD(P)H-dependent glycerol-3-phosphate dehydrogenase [Cognatishimia sp. F0-27]|uniref:NAD(P)H-dependent glycerol-3-phosphate dehydrogenase n=1 Tax=Cognatishimia sp. F0-27 TaxID=2816855 RepID=UPI001D0C1A1A|nr:NAD(P)-dependent glycerol-3-phosphate dehydrogenase [Cognatishimia sp. F0-27]
MSVTVLGAGAFGAALATALCVRGPVTLWARAGAEDMARDRAVPRLPGVRLPDAVLPTADLARAAEADIVMLAVPMQALGPFLDRLPLSLAGKALVACCKGLDLERLTGPSAVIGQACPDAVAAVLTGPSFADDIARGLPTALTLACADEARGAALQAALSTHALRLYASPDPLGAELGGALKNVVAIGCGAVMGAGLGDSARAALMTRGFAEMTRLAAHLGARPETLTGLSGLGDLALTCGSPLSRNFRYGQAIGRGDSFDASVTVEGAATARAVDALARREALDLPVCAAVARLASGEADLATLIDMLLNRPLKKE